MDRKALKKALGLKGYMVKERREREKENKKLKRQKLDVLTTEKLASINSWKRNLKQYKAIDKVLYAF